MKKNKAGIKTLAYSVNGETIDVFGTRGTILNVPANLLRCALGASDTEYLLQSNADESGCFSVTDSEWADFKKYGGA
jgi:hypothetical protein